MRNLAAKLSAGDKIGDYTLLSPIDTGAMGALWEVVDASSNHRTMKFFSVEGMDEALRRQFFVEATLLKVLSSPSLPDGVCLTRVFDIAVSEPPLSIPYYVMDNVKNVKGEYRTLRDIQYDPFREEEYSVSSLALWFVDVAKTLAYIHRMGMVHGDIKPANIMINKQGHAVLVDFGAVRIVGENMIMKLCLNDETWAPLAKFCVGTNAFMAPELRNINNLAYHSISSTNCISTPSSDIYSLGATFWQLLFDEEVADKFVRSPPEKVIEDEDHKVLLSDSRFIKVLPKMLSPYVDERISLEKCLEVFNERIDFDMNDISKRDSKALELCDKAIFEPKVSMILQTLDEYVALLPRLVFADGEKVYAGEAVFACIYEKYRKQELKLLKRLLEGEASDERIAIEQKIEFVDKLFMADFNSAKLKPLADILFDRLNALWGMLCHGGIYSDADKSLMERCVAVARSYLSPASQYVFGKYRHIAWELDSNRYFTNMRKSEEYRGERAADRLFMYEKTLASYVPEYDVANFHLSSLAERNRCEKLKPDETIDFARLWALK